MKPVAILVHGDYDDEAISKGIKNKKEPDYYYKGTPVLDLRKDMQGFDVYLKCILDGHFHDKTRDSLKEFQKIAMSKKRQANGQVMEADATALCLRWLI